MNTTFPPGIERFLEKPWSEKRLIISRYARQAWSSALAPLPTIRWMDPGFLWVVWGDVIRDEILNGNFEITERKFVERFLRPGITVLDIGAYYGLYTLTASEKVGNQGRVIAFEPAPFQRKRLRLHLRLNRRKNVRVEEVALGAVEGEETFFSVLGESAGFSSLRRPEVGATVKPIRVPVTTLDNYLRLRSIRTVDLIKIDVEGGELDVFKGGERLLRQEPRPLILCELQDIRTEAWGHKAKDTAAFVESFGFRWFKPLPDGSIARLLEKPHQYERNFIAISEERMEQFKEITKNGCCS